MNYLFTYRENNIIKYKVLYNMTFEEAQRTMNELGILDIIGVVRIPSDKRGE